MGFVVGENVGQFNIVAYIGQGGMATIFKAYQTNLDRHVALKVIHPTLKNDQSFVSRLKREATVVANLTHPNIVQVHDFITSEGIPFLVMQFIEGKTLKDVMQEQQLSPNEILNILRPVGEALNFAHARGVLHRDVKPSNIMLDKDGNVFLTDFGLARIERSGESTMSHDMLIGSPQYLSPEQARSEQVDQRTDVYSLGIVLYEMFTGRAPFLGDTPYATIMAQINDPPPSPRSFNPNISLTVEKVLLRCLEKDPANRYNTVRDLVRAMENAVRGPQDDADSIPIVLPFADEPKTSAGTKRGNTPKPAPKPDAVDTPTKRSTIFIPIVIGLLALAVCGALMFGAVSLFTTPTPTKQIAIVLRTATAALPTDLPPSATPPRIAIVVPTPTTGPSRTPVPVVPDAPTGRIAYSISTGEAPDQKAIWLANADGSNSRKIIDAAMWPALSPDGTKIAFATLKEPGIYVANSDGSGIRRLTQVEAYNPQWSPDGKRIVYFQGKFKAGGEIHILNADGSGDTEITPGFSPDWAPDGNRLVYSNCQSASRCGLSVYDLKTKSIAMITTDNGASPQWSPTGDKIIYQADSGSGHLNVFIVNADGSNRKQLTSGKSNDAQPTWSRDGNFIFWRSDQNGSGWAIFVMRADGSNPKRIINPAIPDGTYWGRESLSAR